MYSFYPYRLYHNVFRQSHTAGHLGCFHFFVNIKKNLSCTFKYFLRKKILNKKLWGQGIYTLKNFDTYYQMPSRKVVSIYTTLVWKCSHLIFLRNTGELFFYLSFIHESYLTWRPIIFQWKEIHFYKSVSMSQTLWGKRSEVGNIRWNWLCRDKPSPISPGSNHIPCLFFSSLTNLQPQLTITL